MLPVPLSSHAISCQVYDLRGVLKHMPQLVSELYSAISGWYAPEVAILVFHAGCRFRDANVR